MWFGDMRRVVWVAWLAAAAAAAAAASPLEPAVTARGLSLTSFVRHWQPAPYERVRRHRAAPASAASAPDTLRLSFRAHDRDFTLLLRPDTSSVFAEGAQFHSSSGPLKYTAQVYTGKLEDDESSEVYGVITSDGLFDGTIWTATEEYYVEPLSRYDKSHPSMHSVVYRRSDVEHPRDDQPTLCASHQLHLKRTQGVYTELFNLTDPTNQTDTPLNNYTEDLTKEINRRKKRWLPEGMNEMQDDEPKKNPELPLDLDVPYTSNGDSFEKLSTRKPKVKIDKSNLITKVRLDSEESRPKPKTHVEVIKTKAGVVTVSKDIVKKEPVGYTVLSANASDDNRHVNKRATVDPRKTTCLVYLQADHMFYQRFGSEDACIEVMTRHVQKVNAIYKVTDFNQDGKPDNITFMIKRIKVHTLDALKDPAYRFPNNYGVEKYLELFSEEDYDAFCLAYMFTYRDFEMGTLGLAWTGDLKNAGGVCEKNGHYRGSMKSLNTGIVTLLNYGKHVPPAVSHVTLAHEIGHNFGSPHDPEVCTPFGEDGNYIMFARATSGDRKNNNKFSPCSLRAIDPVLNNKARSPKGCFTEPQPAICGNGVVEEGEECDCGWASECTDRCCRPQAARPHYKPCTLTEHSVCSPSQGPCCTASCSLKFGDKCRSDNGCRDAAHCDGKRAACPASRHKPNRTRCDKELVCYMGECTGSICLAYGLESCQCAPRGDDPRSACELCCRRPGGPCVSSFQWNAAPFDVPDMYAKPGTPCNDYNGYCDVFQRCREVDPSGPLATLRKLLLSDESLAGFRRWVLRHWYAVLLILLAVLALLVASTRFLGRNGKKLKSVTIIHSSTTETVRLPDAADQGMIVHTAVRSKLPLKKKVALRTKAYRNKKDHKNKQGDKASPAHSSKKRKPSHPAKPEELAKVTKESTVVVTNADGKSPKHVLLSKHKGKVKKRKTKIKKETIDYSSMQKHPSTPTEDTEALTKVQKWLLSSPQPTVLPKSKSIPLGLTERSHRPAPKGTRKTRPSKSATNLISGEKARLQVVFKPPFRFSVKICKSDKTKVVLDKSSKPDLDRKRQEAGPQLTSSVDHAKSSPSQNKVSKHSNSTKNDVDVGVAPTCPKPTDKLQKQDSGHRYANLLPRSASDCKLVKNTEPTRQIGHKKSNSVGQRKETTESRQNLIVADDGDAAHVYENVAHDAPRSCSMPRRRPAARQLSQPAPRALLAGCSVDTRRDSGTASSSGSSRRDGDPRRPRASRQNSLADKPARLRRQLSENQLAGWTPGAERLRRQLSAAELRGGRAAAPGPGPQSAGAEPRPEWSWGKRASLDCERPRRYTFGELKHAAPDARALPEDFLNLVDDYHTPGHRMAPIRYSLHYEDYSEHLMSRFGKLLQVQSLVDMTLMCSSHTLRVHKAVLAASSAYFQEVLQKQSGEPLIILKMRFSVLKSLVEFMYCGKTQCLEENLDELVSAAQFLKIKGLSKVTKEGLGINNHSELPVFTPPVVINRLPQSLIDMHPQDNSDQKLLASPAVGQQMDNTGRPNKDMVVRIPFDIENGAAGLDAGDTSRSIKPRRGRPTRSGWDGAGPLGRAAERALMRREQDSRKAIHQLKHLQTRHMQDYMDRVTLSQAVNSICGPESSASHSYMGVDSDLMYMDQTVSSNVLDYPKERSLRPEDIAASYPNTSTTSSTNHSSASINNAMSQYVDALKNAGLPTDLPILFESGDGSYINVNEQVLLDMVQSSEIQYEVIEQPNIIEKVADPSEIKSIDDLSKSIERGELLVGNKNYTSTSEYDKDPEQFNNHEDAINSLNAILPDNLEPFTEQQNYVILDNRMQNNNNSIDHDNANDFSCIDGDMQFFTKSMSDDVKKYYEEQNLNDEREMEQLCPSSTTLDNNFSMSLLDSKNSHLDGSISQQYNLNPEDLRRNEDCYDFGLQTGEDTLDCLMSTPKQNPENSAYPGNQLEKTCTERDQIMHDLMKIEENLKMPNNECASGEKDNRNLNVDFDVDTLNVGDTFANETNSNKELAVGKDRNHEGISESITSNDLQWAENIDMSAQETQDDDSVANQNEELDPPNSEYTDSVIDLTSQGKENGESKNEDDLSDKENECNDGGTNVNSTLDIPFAVGLLPVTHAQPSEGSVLKRKNSEDNDLSDNFDAKCLKRKVKYKKLSK